MKNKLKTYLISIAIPLAVGGLSALLTMGNMDLYSEINSPPLAPPAWLFPVAWTVLYVLMGVSCAMILLTPAPSAKMERAVAVYAASLVFNFGWSIIFFNLRAFFVAFAWLLILWAMILATILVYRPINKTAAYLQIPYLIWVAFAGYLNLAVAMLN